MPDINEKQMKHIIEQATKSVPELEQISQDKLENAVEVVVDTYEYQVDNDLISDNDGPTDDYDDTTGNENLGYDHGGD